ncbi:MAG TPA: hypothetical protein VJG65_00790, partial [Patescibacteria group bacterium]|nr:hypothetical protein [Patescibacteria group bacterium]
TFKSWRCEFKLLIFALVISFSTTGLITFALALVVLIFSYKIKLVANPRTSAFRLAVFRSKILVFFRWRIGSLQLLAVSVDDYFSDSDFSGSIAS